MRWKRGKYTAFLFAFQAVFLVLFGIFVKYGHDADASYPKNSKNPDKGGNDPDKNSLGEFYPMFQDVHVMIFVGFGYLMTFLKRYGYGSISFNFMIAAFGIQWATLVIGFFHLHDGYIEVDVESMLGADFAVAAVLISYGAVLGKASPFQLIIMTLIEIALFVVNEVIGRQYFGAIDMGDSIFVHVFGAYFGMTVARVLYTDEVDEAPANLKEEPVYHSDFFSMLGTLFLWMFWPSFNAALASGDDRHRAVLNTYYALCACTIVAFACSALVDEDDKFHTDHIQNSTLAGGVAVGAVGDLMIQPWGAMVIGCVAGMVSVLGFRYLTPALEHKLKIHDTCGVHNLHGLPGVIAAIASIIMAALATQDMYGFSLYQIYPLMAPLENSTALADVNEYLTIGAGEGRSPGYQAAMQAAALGVTMGIAIVGGLITGLILKCSFWDQPQGDEIFDDEPYWLIPLEGYPHVYVDGKPLPNKGDKPFDDMGRRMSVGGIVYDDENNVKVTYNNGAYIEGPEKL